MWFHRLLSKHIMFYFWSLNHLRGNRCDQGIPSWDFWWDVLTYVDLAGGEICARSRRIGVFRKNAVLGIFFTCFMSLQSPPLHENFTRGSIRDSRITLLLLDLERFRKMLRNTLGRCKKDETWTKFHPGGGQVWNPCLSPPPPPVDGF